MKEILDDDIYRKKYAKINLRKLVLILEKYKNDKFNSKESTGSAEMDQLMAKMPRVRKREAQEVAKKLRESLNFSKS